ncbi:aldo/keto reductase [Microlunatus speluncae]|uniref:aldo/keto reductase n=1 Tax=Microlunatus speluncae TaxID=2594267 RepID=UPI0012664297|nr:aldo/keto reductase [Microlunatus speluncae]
MVNAVRWAVIGPGNIARRFATQLSSSQYGSLVSVGSSDPERARTFAEEFGAAKSGDYDSVLSDPEVDAVYVATVHTTHAELTIAALQAGKHVLCEKPIAPNHGQAMAMVDAARAADRVLVEAYMYRFHPQTKKVLELVGDGTIGDLVHIDAAFAFATGRSEGRLFDPNLAGGGILDVGGYPISYARAIAGAAAGKPFLDPISLDAKGTVDGGVDVWSVAQLSFAGGVTASARTGIRVSESSVTVYGTKGLIKLSDPWTLSEQPVLTLTVAGQDPQELTFEAKPYALEADGLAAAVGVGETTEISLDDSLGNAKALDAWREAISLRYPFEADDADIPTVSGQPLRVDDSTMIYGEIAGIGKRVSRLVMGCDNQPNLSHASALFDHFYSLGGNAFDTAYIYGRGAHETLLGQWIRNRGVREDVVVITKGAHTPHCDPESITRQLLESLERQGTDYADIYLMHRDNEDIPVGEFVDVLDGHVKAGRIKVFGGSNWRPERIDEANAYARTAGKQGFELLSNHFGLAEAYDVPWNGCRHATDPESKRWLAERQIPLLPWSSQARGFFTGRARPDDRSDEELVRCYYSDENFERLRRAEKVAAEFGVAATAIALAFVLHQPFPTFPLFGPRSIAETRSSIDALKVKLTPEQVAYLDLASD